MFWQWFSLFLWTKSLNWPSFHNSLTQALLCSWKHSRLLEVFKDACHTWLQLIFGELTKPGWFPAFYTVGKEGPWSWLVPTLKDLSAKFLSYSLFAATSLSCSVTWTSSGQFQCLEASQSDQGSTCGQTLEGFSRKLWDTELFKQWCQEQIGHFTRENFSSHQTSDLVFKEDTEPSSKGESLSHSMRDKVSIRWFNFQSFSGLRWLSEKKTIQFILFMG